MEKFVPGQPAPGRKIFRCSQIEGGDLEDAAGHSAQAPAQVEHQRAAAEVAGVPFRIGMQGIDHFGTQQRSIQRRVVNARRPNSVRGCERTSVRKTPRPFRGRIQPSRGMAY